MKVNLPVTDNEQVMRDGQTIVSKTDLKGIITFANQDFIDISGFTEAELIGKNHNIVRHPDVPAGAFGDLWQTLKAGRPWTGIVKNRCKNGDFYWVEANVAPIFEAGEIAGYLSVRNKPSREQISAAETVYKLAAEGKVGLREGSVIRSPWRDRLNLFRRFSILKKLMVVSAIPVIAVILFASVLILDRWQALQVVETEQLGVEHLTYLKQTLRHIADHRSQSTALLAGDSGAGEGLDALGNQISDDLVKIRQLVGQHQNRFQLEENLEGLESYWEEIREGYRDHDPAENVFLHTELQSDLMQMFRLLGKHSGLKQDPNVNTQNWSILLIELLPQMADFLSQSQSIVTALQASGELDEESESGLTNTFYSLTILDERSRRLLEETTANTPGLEEKTTSPFGEYKYASSGLLPAMQELMANKVLTGEESGVTPEDFSNRSVQGIDGLLQLFDIGVEQIYVGLSLREQEAMKVVYFAVGAALFIVLATILISYILLRRSVAIPLQETLKIFRRISSGEYHNRIEPISEDEISNVLRGLKAMQIKLGFDITEAERRADEALRIQTALDNVSSSVMVADRDHNIIYINRAAQKLFHDIEKEILTEISDFSAEAIIGTSIDRFHKHPEQQRQLLDQLTTTDRSRINLGSRIFDIASSPVMDDEGERQGAATEWSDVTEQVQVEEEVAAVVEGVVQGELQQHIDLEGKHGFMRSLGTGINRLTQVVAESVSEMEAVLGSLSDGDLTRKLSEESEGAFGRLSEAANRTVDKLRNMVQEIQSSADAITQSTSEIASGSTEMSRRAETQASSLEETAASMEELTSTVQQNAENASVANQLAIAGRSVGEQGGVVVTQTVQAMEEISQSSSKIANIIGVIDEIAFQTNLLALNASVEAARAGEKGRGFAVVAAEVRNLAQRSATAAGEIKTLIKDSEEKVATGSDLVNKSGETLREMIDAMTKVGDVVSEIAAASSEQAEGIRQVNQAVIQLDDSTQQNAALSEETSAASQSLNDQAKRLVELVSNFTLPGK
ncbi:MAG: methyl-accepting chemotaxis protein [Chromatiales bacterium]